MEAGQEQRADKQDGKGSPVAHILVGFIGSGKTTFARRLERETGAVRFTKDEWMVRLFGNTPAAETFPLYDDRMAALARDMAIACLRAGVDVIIDEGFWTREHRDEIRASALAAGAIARMYVIDTPDHVMKERTLRRSLRPPIDSFEIDEAAFDHYRTLFEPPGPDEACIRIDGTARQPDLARTDGEN